MHSTWYVLENGAAVDPDEVSPDGNGRLKHRDGYVAMRGSAYASRGVTAQDRAKVSRSEPKRYKTREAKAE